MNLPELDDDHYKTLVDAEAAEEVKRAEASRSAHAEQTKKDEERAAKKKAKETEQKTEQTKWEEERAAKKAQAEEDFAKRSDYWDCDFKKIRAVKAEKKEENRAQIAELVAKRALALAAARRQFEDATKQSTLAIATTAPAKAVKLQAKVDKARAKVQKLEAEASDPRRAQMDSVTVAKRRSRMKKL